MHQSRSTPVSTENRAFIQNTTTEMSLERVNGMVVETPFFSFGAIADIQYADADNILNYHKTHWRHYRNAADVLKQAVKYWNSGHPHSVSLTLQLGDIIDGKARHAPHGSEKALDKILNELNQFKGSLYHIWGNHESYNFPRAKLFNSSLNTSPYQGQPDKDLKGYYAIYPHEKVCFIILDTYEFSMEAYMYEKSNPIYQQAEELVRSRNPNTRCSPKPDWRSAEGLVGTEKRFVCFNGGVSEAQLQWLDETLKHAQKQGKHVIIAGKE